MAEFPIMPVNVSMLLADTAGMTPLQFGCYTRILYHLWLHGGRFTYSREALRNVTGTTPDQWRQIEAAVMRPFIITEGEVTQKRLTETFHRVRETRAKRVAAGVKGHRKPWKPNVISTMDFPPKPLK